ncbi:MAG: type I-C CRISPR-associated protein Cas8c/Csd1 [Fibrobacteres bacterium]|nr:type I-C CRISPR-associated protein Cas8c/Csd1 [Fibrobacterota bacterium]
MILQALMTYYHRKELPPIGFDYQEIPFIIVIDENGCFVNLEDTREKKGSRLRGKPFLIPAGKERSGKNSWQTSNLLWDHFGYVLGYPKDESKEAKERAENQHNVFCDEIRNLINRYPNEIEFKVVLSFLTKKDFSGIINHENWNEIIKIAGCNLSFRIISRPKIVAENPCLLDYVEQNQNISTSEDKDNSDEKILANCLLTGEYTEIARIQPQTPLPTKKSKSTAKLVSFQKNCGYDSYGKEQSYNSPISLKAAGAYGISLNHLLGSKQRTQVGDDSIVFWAEKTDDMEVHIVDIFGEPEKDDPDRNIRAVQRLFNSVKTGSLSDNDNENNKFYILGLSPNVARISIRFWFVTTVRDLSKNLIQHFEDLKLSGPDFLKEHFGINVLIKSTTRSSEKHPYGNYDDLPPRLTGEFVFSALNGTLYPSSLLIQILNRIKAEGEIPPKGDRLHFPRIQVDHCRYSIIKAIINRKTRYSNPSIKEELKMSLDETNKNTGYRLGRLFAALEKIQAEAHPGLNATIRDRYYGAASGTPVTVFPILMRMKNHHISKLENKGRAVNLEKMLAEIIDGISDFPAHLPIDDQGRFAIGYYHQTQKFYQKNTKEGEV